MLHLLLVLHLLLFLFSFAFTAGVGILLARVARNQDSRTIHAAFISARPLSMLGGIGWILTALAGVALAKMAGIPLSQPWLQWSYVAFAVLILTGFLLHAPFQAKVIAASSEGAPREKLDALLRSPIGPLASLLSAISVIALVYLMSSRLG